MISRFLCFMSILGYIDVYNDDEVDDDDDDDDVDDVLVGERVCTHRLSDAASWGEKTHTLCIYWQTPSSSSSSLSPSS